MFLFILTWLDNYYYSSIARPRPGAPLHEFAGVSDGVAENKERIPETGTGEHADEVEFPVLTDVIDHYKP